MKESESTDRDRGGAWELEEWWEYHTRRASIAMDGAHSEAEAREGASRAYNGGSLVHH